MPMISGLEDIPNGEHWAIIRQMKSIIPGDERSRTSPGHGYPESVETHFFYEVFTSEETFRNKLLSAFMRNEDVRGIHVTATYSKKVTYEVSRQK